MTYNLKEGYATCSELVTNDKSISTIYGRRPSDGALIPINIDDQGNILLGTGITLNANDLNIGSITLKDTNSSTELDVIQIGDSISLPPFSGSSDAYRGVLVLGRSSSGSAQPLGFDASGNLLVSNLDVPLSTLETTLASIEVALGALPLFHAGMYVYGEQLAVAADATVTLVTYTVPPERTFYWAHTTGSGDTSAKYEMSLNASKVSVQRASYAVFNVDFVVTGITCNAGDVLHLIVTNAGTGSANFNGTIYGQLV